MLRAFKMLKVPSGKLSNLNNVLSLRVAQQQMLELNETALVQLQEEINEAEKSAEHTKDSIQTLKRGIQELKDQLEEEEKKASKEEALMVNNQKGLLEDLNTIQQSADVKNMLTFIEKVYEKVDFI
ncbi:hypothetical protein ASZ78_003050 [Callipepla squamata]|uniref:Centromere protein Q n=1 Tax=Callipepla squamata TaxID=9009 RepID=A0A226N5M1_CALSU|nr:hypothetical protein ASZ78_003050 [Callipepla squamata]